MNVVLNSPEDTLTDRFEAQLRPLVRAVRLAVEDQLFQDPGDCSVGRILQDAPADACLRLSDSWAVADLVGVSPADLLARFDAIDRFLIEMVTGIYSDARCDLFGQQSTGLLDNSGLFAQPV
ncbi:MAG: hypothetical protein U0798_02085 [Gemmataceae bacterium]